MAVEVGVQVDSVCMAVGVLLAVGVGVRVGVFTCVGVKVGPTTVIVPCIKGWMSQWYVNTPVEPNW